MLAIREVQRAVQYGAGAVPGCKARGGLITGHGGGAVKRQQLSTAACRLASVSGYRCIPRHFCFYHVGLA